MTSTEKFDGGADFGSNDDQQLPPAPAPEVPAASGTWTEADAKRYLKQRSATIQRALGTALGVDVAMTNEEVEAIAPGLAQFMAKRPTVRKHIDKDVTIVAGVTIASYAFRVLRTTIAVRRHRRAMAQAAANAQAPRGAERLDDQGSNTPPAPAYVQVPNTQETRTA